MTHKSENFLQNNVAFVCNICASCYWFLIRSRLSYEQFGAFLGNVKDLNAHKQTKDVSRISLFFTFLSVWNLDFESIRNVFVLQETLRKAEEIFGSDNRDLYVIFEGLITRNAHWEFAFFMLHVRKSYTQEIKIQFLLFSWVSSKTKWKTEFDCTSCACRVSISLFFSTSSINYFFIIFKNQPISIQSTLW